MGGSYDGGMMGGDAGGAGMMGGGGGKKSKPIDTQSWQVRLGRRVINQITQATHLALAGVPLPDGKPVAGIKPIKDAQLTAEEQAKLTELVSAIAELQTAVNDPQLVTDMTSLLAQAEGNIEEIMDLVKEVPGFLARYPELAPDDDLPTAEAPGAKRPAATDEGQNPAPDGQAPANEPAAADGTAPAENAAAAPAAPAGT